jgi:hypothetical protein
VRATQQAVITYERNASDSKSGASYGRIGRAESILSLAVQSHDCRRGDEFQFCLSYRQRTSAAANRAANQSPHLLDDMPPLGRVEQ